MTELDDDLVPEALNLIDEFGKDLTFIEITAGTYNPVSGDVTGETTVSQIRKTSPPANFEQKLIDGEIIKQGDLRVFVAASGLAFDLVLQMEVQFDSGNYRIERIFPFYSGDKIAVFELQLRGIDDVN